MKTVQVVKASLSSLWNHKHLWFFGFFIASASGGGVSDHFQGAPGVLPAWAIPAIIGGAILSVVWFVMHLLSEGALIDAIGRERNGREMSLRGELASGRRHAWQVLGIKVLCGLLSVVFGALLALPILGVLTDYLPLGIGVLLAVGGGLVAVPALLTIHVLMQYALRFCVLDGRGALDALRLAKRHLVERLLVSIKLVLVASIGDIAGSVAMAIVALPGALVGYIAYLIGGLIPAIVAGSVVAIPMVVALMGAMGAFKSALWSHAFAEQVRR